MDKTRLMTKLIHHGHVDAACNLAAHECLEFDEFKDVLSDPDLVRDLSDSEYGYIYWSVVENQRQSILPLEIDYEEVHVRRARCSPIIRVALVVPRSKWENAARYANEAIVMARFRVKCKVTRELKGGTVAIMDSKYRDIALPEGVLAVIVRLPYGYARAMRATLRSPP